MCGIIGYIGSKRALPIVIKALERLEYRGYDSIGVLVYDQDKKIVYLEKQPGRIQEFVKTAQLDKEGNLAIGHTRWATHGGVTKANAHPHWDCANKIFVVHNGIIENFQVIKNSLVEKGHKFRSETDTEVIPHLIEEGTGIQGSRRTVSKDRQGKFRLIDIQQRLSSAVGRGTVLGPLDSGSRGQRVHFCL